MSLDEGLIALAAEAVAPLGKPTMHKMMGGATLYCNRLANAIAARDALWYKADAEADAFWDAESAVRFSHVRKDRLVGSMNYRRAPDDCYDDPDAFRRCTLHALEAAGRTAAKKRRRD